MKEEMKKEYTRILNIKRNDYIERYGIIFNSDFQNHFYDTGTGKVVNLDDKEYEVIRALLSQGKDTAKFEEAFEKLSEEQQNLFLETCINENLLKAEQVTDMLLFTKDTSLKEQLEHHLQQLVLEVTEQCNFRCKYCIYNEDFAGNRDFGNGIMTIDIAKKAVDYAIEHSGKRVSITFYGGEPLLNFSVIKDAIDYALEIGKNKELSFSITSNLTKMTKEIASYLASVPNLSLLASIDGPENVHNATRVYAGNKPTFEDTMQGLKYVAEAFKKTGNVLMINAVFVPPYEYEKLEAINEFFESLDFLPESTEIRITYPETDSFAYNDWETLMGNGKYLFDGVLDPMKKWQLIKAQKNGLSMNQRRNIYFYSMFSLLMQIDGRRCANEPYEIHSCNGCCVPGGRKIYVKTNGDISVCEKIGLSPILGNIDTGIDLERVQKKYIDEYVTASVSKCAKCWAINFCGCCYADCYTEDGIDIEAKADKCASVRKMYQTNLSIFYSISEEYPELLDVLKNARYDIW